MEVAFRILPHKSVFQTERERWLRVHHPVSTFAAQQLQCIMNKREVTGVSFMVCILGMPVKGTTGKDVLLVAAEGNEQVQNNGCAGWDVLLAADGKAKSTVVGVRRTIPSCLGRHGKDRARRLVWCVGASCKREQTTIAQNDRCLGKPVCVTRMTHVSMGWAASTPHKPP